MVVQGIWILTWSKFDIRHYNTSAGAEEFCIYTTYSQGLEVSIIIRIQCLKYILITITCLVEDSLWNIEGRLSLLLTHAKSHLRTMLLPMYWQLLLFGMGHMWDSGRVWRRHFYVQVYKSVYMLGGLERKEMSLLSTKNDHYPYPNPEHKPSYVCTNNDKTKSAYCHFSLINPSAFLSLQLEE